MSNLTEVTNRLADGQIEIYNVCKRSAERVAYAYELIAALVEVTSQLEQAVGDDPTSQKFQAIADKIATAQESAAADLALFQNAIDALPDFAPGLQNMASTPFNQPPAPAEEPPVV
jgi:predicted ArsR family transcriptional regulator